MTTFETRDAKLYDIGRMARRLRAGHQMSIARVGCNTHRELRECFYRSASLRKAWLVDGELAAIYGAIGTLVSPYIYSWAAFTPLAMKYPVATIKEFRRVLDDEAMVLHNEILTTVIGGDEASLRFAIFLGYHCEHGGRGEPAYTRMGRRDLMDYIKNNPDIRRPIGDGYAIALGYHRQAA